MSVLPSLKMYFKQHVKPKLEEKLGYDKYQISDKTTANSRNGYVSLNM